MKPISRLFIALGLPLIALVVPAVALAGTTLTVCVSGPPDCDYTSIQAAIDAANFGDTVVVSAGTYTEQITLKSGLTLTSTDGPTHTIVMATAGPIVLAEAVTATQLSGFTLDGSAIVTPAIGLSIVDSEFSLANSRIQHVHGLTCTGTINGDDAIGLRITGTFSVTIEHTTIADIQGGHAVGASGWPGSPANGGSATGIAAIGNGQLTITATQIQAITGGNPSHYIYNPYYCPQAGGDSVGISKRGDAALSLSDVSVTQLVGGHPCGLGGYCTFYGGRAIGVHAISGTLAVHHTTVANLTWWASWSRWDAPPTASYGIRSQAADETRIEDTRIFSLTAVSVQVLAELGNRPTSPVCGPPPGTGIGISLEDGQDASVDHTVVDGVSGAGTAGAGLGMQSDRTTYVTLTHNQLLNLYGGNAAGVTVSAAQQADITHNSIGQVRGGDGSLYGYTNVIPGGDAAGIHVISTTSASLVNNLVFALAGGDGSNDPGFDWFQPPQNGGHARGMLIEDTSGRLQNNTLYDLRGGAAGCWPSSASGQGIGLDLRDNTGLLILNNAISSSTVGLSVTRGDNLWGYNALWHTALDYSGIVTGPHDLHADPRFVDAAHGDFRVSFLSPLIDTGFNPLAPADDFAGNPRPIDGNGDGLSMVDIGAYEYQPVPLYKTYLPVVRRF